MDYKIRRATIYDINQINDIEELCFDEADRFNKDLFCLFLLKRKYELFLVATIEKRNDEKIIGFIIAFLNSLKNYEIATINVHPEWRRLGVGYNLLYQLEEAIQIVIPELRKMGILEQKTEEFTIELTVQTDNEIAKNIYQKLEYEDIEFRPNYYRKGRDGIRMIKKIKTSLY